MSRAWPRGSEWRVWDLHLHSPGTKLNDAFASGGQKDVWDAYCRSLESSDVCVFGITDYFSADGYFATVRELSGRFPKSEKVLFPNVELRTAYAVNRAQEEVNVHLIFNPFQPDYEINIRNFLNSLETNKTDSAGRHIKAADLKTTRDYEEATTSREFIIKALKAVLGSSVNLSEYVLIFTAANNDGLRPPRGAKRKELLSDELDKFSDGFLGNSGNVEYYLRRDRYEDKRVASLPKPTVSGSDSHSFKDIETRLGKAFQVDERVTLNPTWIKADPTFEGLRQILFEPRSRVHIGATPPVYHDEARVIRSIKVEKSNGWFEEVELPLNSSLVAIIGQKGSGKSALAELIAYAAGSWEVDEQGGFIRRAGDLIADIVVTLTWADGSTTAHRIGDDQSDERKVRYLSQKFVERLCAEDAIGAELIREIENVIFAHTDPTDTLGASNFEEMRSAKTESIRIERDELRGEIVRLIREETSLMDSLSKVAEKQARIKTLSEEAAGLTKQIPTVTNDADKRTNEELLTRRTTLAALQNLVSGYKSKIQKVTDIRSRVLNFKAQMDRFYSEIGAMLSEAGLSDAESKAFRPAFFDDTDGPLLKHLAQLQNLVRTKEGEPSNPKEGTIHALTQHIKALEAKESTDKTRQQRIKSIQDRLISIKSESSKITAEIERLQGAEKARLLVVRSERNKAYEAFFTTLCTEQKLLEELYRPVKQNLGLTAAGRVHDLEFSIRREVDIEGWLDRGSNLFDQRRTLPYGTMQDLSKAAHKILLPAWIKGEPSEIKDAIESFLAPFREMKPSTFLRSGIGIREVKEWLYGVDHVRLNYGIKYNGTDLSKLSPGTKGIVLLILYLGMDTDDTRPLIVDQPDENLDNESIYELLRSYFQDAKARRQIIVISHNPNLVVNADSEQVLVATCDRRADGLPHISYEMGSLEDSNSDGTGIRQRACRILEGGDIAFQRRENRYAIGRKSTGVAS